MAGIHLTFVLLGVIAIAQTLVVPDPGPVTYPPNCGPVCQMDCPKGFVLDQHGCPICRCRLRSCQDQCLNYCRLIRRGLPPFGCACNCLDYRRLAY